MENIVIGIEGMVGAGKTTICKELTNLIPNSIFIDASKIYRGIAYATTKNGFSIEDFKNNASNINPMDLMQKLKVEFKIENKTTEIYVDGSKIPKEIIGNAKNSMSVSIMAANSNNEELYKFARKILDGYRRQFNVIFSARDIINIYPEITCHVYITADFDERVKRRYNQYEGKYSIQEIETLIKERDKLHEESGFNKLSKNSIYVDVTECRNVEESAQKVKRNITEFIEQK